MVDSKQWLMDYVLLGVGPRIKPKRWWSLKDRRFSKVATSLLRSPAAIDYIDKEINKRLSGLLNGGSYED